MSTSTGQDQFSCPVNFRLVDKAEGKTKNEHLVSGSGEAGKYLAWHLAGQGERVAVVERRYVGGSCPNIACLPSKNVIHSAKVVAYFRRSEEYGIHKEGWKIDMQGVRERKRQMVDGLIQIQLNRYRATGTELVLPGSV